MQVTATSFSPIAPGIVLFAVLLHRSIDPSCYCGLLHRHCLDDVSPVEHAEQIRLGDDA